MTTKTLAMATERATERATESLTGLLGTAREARGAGWGEYLTAGLITLGILVALMI